MDAHYIIKENWLTKRPQFHAAGVTIFLILSLIFSNSVYWNNSWNFSHWLVATRETVLNQHQYWRAWIAIFLHADFEHLLSNLILFIPLTVLLTSYYGLRLFPLLGIFFGGLINLIVLKTMPVGSVILGISGVVYWMGAVWLTLFMLIDRRLSLRRRFAYTLFLSLILFLPESYKPEVSYYSHFLGFVFGIVTGCVFYSLKHKTFLAAEVQELVVEEAQEFVVDVD